MRVDTIYNGLVLKCIIVFVRIVCNLLDPDEFEYDVSSVEEPGYLFRIPDPNFSFPDPG